jgi:glycerol-3-phosphate dehydrogenase
MEVLTGEQARALEPNLSEAITSVLRVPSAGIICPYGMTIAAVGNAMDNGVELKLNFEVCAIEKKDGVFTVTAKNGESVSARYIVNAAGAYSDKIAEMAGDKFFEIIPRAGEYHLLDKGYRCLRFRVDSFRKIQGGFKVRHRSDPQFPELGLH